tara:strand:+ start:2288 stop:2692 length:405 start_codon:yes stop_codon:yes gene_type:complete
MKTPDSISKIRLWSAYILHTLIVLLLLMGAINNLLQTEMAVKGAMEMGYPSSSIPFLGIVLLLSTILFAIPRTTFLGALLITAWLGGAVATHIINSDPIHFLFIPVLFGILVWGSIWLRNDKLGHLIRSVKSSK